MVECAICRSGMLITCLIQRIDFIAPATSRAAAAPAVEDARGLPRKNSSVRAWMAVQAGLGCSMTAKRSTPANSPAPSGTGGDGRQVADGGGSPILQREAE